MKILIFGGTTEGRELTKLLAVNNELSVAITSVYGKQLIAKNNNINVISNRLNELEIDNLIKKEQFEIVIDATHPYANIVTENVKSACLKNKVKYIRLVREFNLRKNDVKYFKNYEEVVKYLQNKNGNILLTIGSKELEIFTHIKNYYERVYVRIIPMLSSLDKAINLGYKQKNIICMQGPFSFAMNRLMLKELEIVYLVTKNSGKISGFEEKIDAALKCNVKVLVIDRPTIEIGMSFNEILDYFGGLS